MTKWYNPTTKTVETDRQLHRALAASGVSSRFPVSVATAIEHGRIVVVEQDPPIISDTQVAERAALPSEDGIWRWVVRDLSIQELADKGEQLANEVRQERNERLNACDWVATRARELGQSVPLEWYEYRGDLRQIPEQEGFPFNVVWPKEPE